MKNRTKWIVGFVCASPIIILMEILTFSQVMEMIREKSDMSVMFGYVIISIVLFINYLLGKLINIKLKIK